MAVDTKAKRFSMLSLGVRVLIPDPDGTIDAGDRLHLTGLYSGVTAGAPTVTVPCYVLEKASSYILKSNSSFTLTKIHKYTLSRC